MNDYYVIDGTQADAVDAGMNLFTGLGLSLIHILQWLATRVIADSRRF